jgi:hypothetical protein
VISFELPAHVLTRRGFLAPFRYHAADMWLHADGDTPIALLPGTEYSSEKKQLLNSSAAFPHIAEALRQHMLSKDDQRTLVVAPNVALAGELVEYLNNLPDFRDSAVRLTSLDKSDKESALCFDHTYQAWKTGAWPVGSPFSDERVPTIVVAVDLFKEGTDAPGIRTLINWADTNSLISFLQTLGRGLRPDSFKSCLDVVDIAGTFRKVHLLQWLGDRSESKPGSSAETRGSDSEGSRCEGVGRPLCELSEDVSKPVQAFLADVPQTLARRYMGKSYWQIPAAEIEKLNECIISRLGFKNPIEFNSYIENCGPILLNPNHTSKEVAEIRAFLAKAYFNNENDINAIQIPAEAATILVHAHLLQAFQSHLTGFEPKHFIPVFPEFSDQALDLGRLVGANLGRLRLWHFGVSPVEMAEKLYRERVSKEALEALPDVLVWLANMMKDPSLAKLEFHNLEGKTRVPDVIYQKYLIDAYLLHRDIYGKLEAKDFSLTRAEFENLLIEKGLIKPSQGRLESRREFYNVLQRDLSGIVSELESKVEKLDRSKINRCELLLFNEQFAEMVENLGLVRERFKSLEQILNSLKNHANTKPEIQKIIDQLQVILNKGCGRKEVALKTLPGHVVAIRNSFEGDNFWCSIEGPLSDRFSDLPYQPMHVKKDCGRTHILITSPLLAKLSSFSKDLSNAVNLELAQAFRSLIEDCVLRLTSEQIEEAEGTETPVVIVPNDDSSLFAKHFREELFNNTELSILNGGYAVYNGVGDSTLAPSIDQALGSHVSGLTPESLGVMTQLSKVSRGNTFVKGLLHNYKVLQFARDRIAREEATLNALFDKAKLPPKSVGHLEIAKGVFESLNRRDIPIYGRRFERLETAYNLLKHINDKGGFDPYSALLMATWGAHSSISFSRIDQNNSSLRVINQPITQLLWALMQGSQRDIKLPDALQNQVNEVLEILLTSLIKTARGSPVMFDGVNPDDQEKYGKELGAKISELATQVRQQLNLEPNSAGQSPKGVEAKDAPVNRERQPGHPFFNEDREPVFFLTGTKNKPAIHLDPNCAARLNALEKMPKKDPLPTEALTLDDIDIKIEYRKKAECCKACKMPKWSDQENYSDVRKRFIYNEDISAQLPSEI